jgi:hypothetical protein
MGAEKTLRNEADRFEELAEQLGREDLRQTALKIADQFKELALKAEAWDDGGDTDP